MPTDDDKLKQTLIEIQEDLTRRFGDNKEKVLRRRLKRNNYCHTHYKPNYVARMYQQAKEEVEWE